MRTSLRPDAHSGALFLPIARELGRGSECRAAGAPLGRVHRRAHPSRRAAPRPHPAPGRSPSLGERGWRAPKVGIAVCAALTLARGTALAPFTRQLRSTSERRLSNHRTGTGVLEKTKTLPRMARWAGLVLLISGLLVAVAGSLCACIPEDAGRTAEARAVAAALWTAVTSQANDACGSAMPVAAAFRRVGLDSAGSTTPPRWRIIEGVTSTLTADCATGAYALAGDGFTVAGTAKDVSAIRVKLSDAAASPPPQFQCSTNAGSTWVNC